MNRLQEDAFRGSAALLTVSFTATCAAIVIAFGLRELLRCSGSTMLKHRQATQTQEKNPLHDFWEMGSITPLRDFDYRTTDPLRVYNFKPKYFLTMGTQRTTVDHIAHIDSRYVARLAARQAITAARPEVLACMPNARGAVEELYSYLVQHWLPQRYPSIFRVDPERSWLENVVTGRKVPWVPPVDGRKALELLNQHVDDDFLIMLPHTGENEKDEPEEFYALSAFIWSFPDHTNPSEKLGQSLKDIHRRVPGYPEKLEVSMDRYFRKVRVGDVVYRTNWGVSIKASETESQLTEVQSSSKLSQGMIDPAQTFVRCELQTLFRLPKSRALVLSIHEYVYPMKQIKDAGDGPLLNEAIDGIKLGNVPGMWDYKRASDWAEPVKAYLREERPGNAS